MQISADDVHVRALLCANLFGFLFGLTIFDQLASEQDLNKQHVCLKEQHIILIRNSCSVNLANEQRDIRTFNF